MQKLVWRTVMNEGLVSVIMPTYNHAAFIGEAIKSVQNQTYENWELLIINNYSEDNTAEVVGSIKDPRIKFINFHNKGIIASSRNTGIKNSKGDFIAFLDSDDVWMKEKLEVQLNTFKKNPYLMMIGTNALFYPGPGKKVLKIRSDLNLSFNKLLYGNKLLNSSVIIKKTAVDSAGCLDENIELRTVEDYDYWLRILHRFDKSGMVIKDPLILYRIHDQNLSGAGYSIDYIKNFEKDSRVIEKYRDENQALINLVLTARKKMAVKYQIKQDYFLNKISFTGLMIKNDVSLLDKIEIFIKNILKRLLES